MESLCGWGVCVLCVCAVCMWVWGVVGVWGGMWVWSVVGVCGGMWGVNGVCEWMCV